MTYNHSTQINTWPVFVYLPTSQKFRCCFLYLGNQIWIRVKRRYFFFLFL